MFHTTGQTKTIIALALHFYEGSWLPSLITFSKYQNLDIVDKRWFKKTFKMAKQQ